MTAGSVKPIHVHYVMLPLLPLYLRLAPYTLTCASQVSRLHGAAHRQPLIVDFLNTSNAPLTISSLVLSKARRLALVPRRITAREPLPKKVHARTIKASLRACRLVVDVGPLPTFAEAHAARRARGPLPTLRREVARGALIGPRKPSAPSD